jgi:uncharacterized protein (DUF305 family)
MEIAMAAAMWNRTAIPRAVGVIAVLAVTGCAAAGPRAPAPAQPAVPPLPHSEADTHFMTGMIPHHAQALRMARWAMTHASRSDVRILAERMLVAQADEIELMRNWLADRGEPVPPADATHARMTHGGMTHDMLMPGMLTDDELARLERARGVEFDRLFLTYMIRHHEGALEMVETLFGSYGAAQDEVVFRFASDVFADQSTEIDRMESILAELSAGAREP